MDEQEFQKQAERSLQAIYRKLATASDRYDFEADFNAGALAIEFEEPKGKFVVSPNTPVRQIWVSAHSKSYKLSWDAARSEFVLSETSESLEQMLASAIGRQIGEEVSL